MSVGIGERIRALRTERGLSQEEVARRTGVSLGSYGDIERGVTTDPHYSTLRGISHALGVPIDRLLQEEPAAPLDEASQTGPPQVSKEALAAQGITATDDEVEDLNLTLMSLWRLGQGEKVVSQIGPGNVDTKRIFMLVHLVLQTPEVVTPQAAGILDQGMREMLKTG
jgi:transcriptional regulator with XRE-family HTH domain